MFIGASSGKLHSAGTANLFIGAYSGYNQTVAAGNILIGHYAGHRIVNASNNIALGNNALYNYSNTNLNVYRNNIAIGNDALLNTNATNSTNALNNLALGHSTGLNNTIGSEITILGNDAEVGSNNLINAAAIGSKAQVNTSDAMVLGSINGINGATSTVKVGVGTALPVNRLDDSGSIGMAIRTITVASTSNLTIDDHTIIITSAVAAGTVTLYLPAANTCARREYVIVNQNVTTAKTFNINYLDFTGATVNTIPANGSITLQSNGINWYRIR